MAFLLIALAGIAGVYFYPVVTYQAGEFPEPEWTVKFDDKLAVIFVR